MTKVGRGISFQLTGKKLTVVVEDISDVKNKPSPSGGHLFASTYGKCYVNDTHYFILNGLDEK
jgi:hypothetical protein